MSEQDINQALINIAKFLKRHRASEVVNNMDSSNTGICIVEDIGEVVYFRGPPSLLNEDEVEFIFYNNGIKEGCGGFGIDRPFTSPGTYRNTFDDEPIGIEKIEPIPNLEKKLAKLALLI